MQISQTDWPETDFTKAVESLAQRHYAVIPHFLSPEMLEMLRRECLDMHQAGHFHAASVGRAAGQQLNQRIRGDSIRWLEADFPAGGRYLARMAELQALLNRDLFLGLRQFETHYAHYEPGSFYQRHVDRHRDNDARVISAVCYLNPDWPQEAGGEIRVWNEQDEEVARLSPQGGTLLLFTSHNMPHEVLPANRVRLSLAGWFRRDVA
jgi:SM-20-related protein